MLSLIQALWNVCVGTDVRVAWGKCGTSTGGRILIHQCTPGRPLCNHEQNTRWGVAAQPGLCMALVKAEGDGVNCTQQKSAEFPPECWCSAERGRLLEASHGAPMPCRSVPSSDRYGVLGQCCQPILLLPSLCQAPANMGSTATTVCPNTAGVEYYWSGLCGKQKGCPWPL